MRSPSACENVTNAELFDETFVHSREAATGCRTFENVCLRRRV